jgi:D-alanine-D-alanine ligase
MKSAAESVLVLHESLAIDARPDEQDTLAQVEQVCAALQRLGYRVSQLATDLDLQASVKAIDALAPDCIFNLVESLAGKGQLIHLLPALLTAIGRRFTGCGSDAMYLSSNKLMAKQWLRLNHLPTPASFLADEEVAEEDLTWIVKSVWEHASFGLDDGCVVSGVPAARARLRHCAGLHGGDWFAEQYIDGREFNVALLEIDARAIVLPIAEMAFIDYPRDKPRIVGYAAKWDQEAPEYYATQRAFTPLAQPQQDAIEALGQACWQLFGLRGYARVDLRMDDAGRLWILEVNANPCLSDDAGFAAAASQAGIGYDDLVHHILLAGVS